MTLNFVIDWLEFTYKVPEGLNGLSVWDNFLADFPEFEEMLDDMVLLEKGRNGYTHVFAFTDEFTISYNPEEDRLGVHVTFPSRGLYRIMTIFGLDDFSEYADAAALFRILKERSCKISRLDIAYDDYSKTFTPHDFAKWKLDGRISTQCKVFGFMSSQANEGGTFYLGKRGGDRFLRIYDKEYESKGVIDAIRYEFELRRDWAAFVQDRILEGKDFCIADLIDQMFYITGEYDLSGDKHLDSVRKVRAGVEEKWQLFLETMREQTLRKTQVEVKVCNLKQQNSFQKTEEWIKGYVLPTLFMCTEVWGIDKLIEMLQAQKGRLKPMQRAMLEKYKWEANQ